MVAALGDNGYPLLDVFWTIMIFFLWFLWIWMLFVVYGDIFRRSDIGGWAKAGWVVFTFVLPYLGVLVYLIVHGRGMAERRGESYFAAQSQFDSQVRSVVGKESAADQISKGKQLLDSGTITPAEFEALKRRTLAAQ